MKKIFKFIVYIVLIVFIYLIIFPIPVRIDKIIAAVEVALDDKSYCKPVNVIINGTYGWRMVGSDTFDGNIKFDIYPLTVNNELAQGEGIPTLKLTQGTDSLDYGEWLEGLALDKIHICGNISDRRYKYIKNQGYKGVIQWIMSSLACCLS